MATLTNIEQAMAQMPKGCTFLVINDLNVDLEYPRDDRDKAVAEAKDAHDVICFTCHFVTIYKVHGPVQHDFSRIMPTVKTTAGTVPHAGTGTVPREVVPDW